MFQVTFDTTQRVFSFSKQTVIVNVLLMMEQTNFIIGAYRFAETKIFVKNEVKVHFLHKIHILNC